MTHDVGDIEDLPLRRFTSFIWYWATMKADPADVAKFKNKLWLPPKGAAIPKNSPWSTDNERAAFETFKAQATGSKAAAIQ